jgi:hypothetical protein
LSYARGSTHPSMARMSPGLEADAAALVAVAALAALAWVFGSALLGAAPAAERLGAGFLCLFAAAWLVMLQPLAGVSLTGSPWAVRILVVAGAAAIAWRWRPPPIGALDVRPVATTLAASLLVSAPAWLSPGDDYPARSTDILWHEGWIRQLVGGGRAPGGIYADVPNAYPWLEHAIAALVMSAGGLSMAATLIAVEALMLAALATGTWLLAIELGLGRAAAAWASVLALAGGGLGWLTAAGPAAVLTATRADPAATPADLLRFERGIGAYNGDLLLSPAPTAALGNVAPAMPRELGLALVPLAAWAGVRAARRASACWWAAAGAAAGLAFLASPVAGIVAAVVLLAVAAAARRLDAWPAPAAFAVVALVWLGPLGWHAADLGGFVSTTRGTPIEPTAAQALWAFGCLLALAAAGTGLIVRHRQRGMVAAVVAALILPGALAAAVPGLGAVPALTRALHYLPAAALGLALPAGVAAAWLVERAGRWRLAAAAVIAFAACASAAAASAGTVEMLRRSGDEPILRCTTPLGGSGAGTIAVLGAAGTFAPGDPLALTVFARTGAPLLYVQRPRIRFPDVYLHIVPQQPRFSALRGIGVGRPAPAEVTRILAPAADAPPSGFHPAGTCRVGAVADGRYRALAYRWYVR